GKQEKSAVAVTPLRAGNEVERFLARDDGKRVLVRGDAVNIDAGEFEQSQIVAQAAGMVQKMQNRDLVAVVGKFRNVFANIIVNGKLSLFFEKKDAARGELFGSGAYVEHAAWRNRNVFFDIREAVAFFVNDFC